MNIYNKLTFKIQIITAIIVFSLTSCTNSNDQLDFGQAAKEIEDISIINLIATPERFSGKTVRVTGVIVLEFEGNALYLSAADAERNVFKNAVWLELNYSKFGIPEKKPSDPEQLKQAKRIAKSLENMDGKYVLIEGIFDNNSSGHLGLFSGEINVTRIARFSVKKP